MMRLRALGDSPTARLMLNARASYTLDERGRFTVALSVINAADIRFFYYRTAGGPTRLQRHAHWRAPRPARVADAYRATVWLVSRKN